MAKFPTINKSSSIPLWRTQMEQILKKHRGWSLVSRTEHEDTYESDNCDGLPKLILTSNGLDTYNYYWEDMPSETYSFGSMPAMGRSVKDEIDSVESRC